MLTIPNPDSVHISLGACAEISLNSPPSIGITGSWRMHILVLSTITKCLLIMALLVYPGIGRF